MTKRLTEEIHRILNAPYAVSLKGLLNVTSEADAYLLELWASSHPCEIEMLVSMVADGLSWCPFAAPVLENLVTSKSLRCAILRRRPAVLDTLLKKAVASQQSFEKYSQVCVSMLSAPLPVPTPVSLGPFFHRSLEEATGSPTTSNLRRVYSIVSGQCSALPGILPTRQMTQVQEKLISVLKRLDGQSIHLFCLGTFARLVALQKCPSSADDASSSSVSSTKSDSVVEKSFGLVRGFFSAQKAPKTIDLVVLRVISACSSNSNLSKDEALEDVQLATVIMDAVEAGLRGIWVKSNGRTMRKLYEKVLRSDISNVLQFLAFRFILCMVDPNSLPPTIPKRFQTLVSSRLQCQTIDECPIHLSADTIQKMAPCFEEDFISGGLRITMTTLTQLEPSVVYISRLKDCQEFLDGLDEVVEDSPVFRKGLFSALSTNEFENPLREFCEMPIPERQLSGGCATLKLCWTELQESRRRLAASLCSLVLKAVLHSSGDDIGLETSISLSLLGKQKDVAIPMPPCPSVRYKIEVAEGPSTAFLEQKSTPQDIRASHDWKKRLAESLIRDTTQRHEAIVKTVGEVCRELEERCEDIERPLREAQAELGSVQASFDESKRRIVALELEASERELFLDGLDAEKLGLESNMSSASQHNLELERLLQQASDEMKKLELNHLATLAIKDENTAEMEQKIERIEHELGRLDSELGLVKRGRETDALEAATQAEKTELLHNEEMNGLRTLLRVAQQELGLERQKSDHKISELEKDIKEMHCEREERAKEFLHAQDLSKRLMAVMGFGNASPGPSNLTMGKKETTDILTGDRKDQFSDRSGPTPKRLKVRDQVEPLLTQQTAKPSKEQDQSNKRSPLKELVVDNRNSPQEETTREIYCSPGSLWPPNQRVAFTSLADAPSSCQLESSADPWES